MSHCWLFKYRQFIQTQCIIATQTRKESEHLPDQQSGQIGGRCRESPCLLNATMSIHTQRDGASVIDDLSYRSERW